MELYAAVRRSVYVEGLSERAAARRFGLARETVRKMLRYRRPPGYRRAQPVRRPKLDGFTGIIDQILREDQSRPKKQRHTAKRIGERLRAEYGFTGGDTIVKAYVRAQRLGGQEMFVPLAHPPGDAQADFGEALVVIAGVECKAHYLVVDLPHSDDGFVQAFPAETTEAFCDGHNAAFGYFGGVPRRIVYDNTKLAVARILGDGTRQRTQVFCELQSHYLFADRVGRPGKGNDNAYAERFVRSMKEECLSRVVPLGEGHVRLLVGEYVDHDHRERNHQGLDNQLLQRPPPPVSLAADVQRRERLGGLLNFYHREAA